ncbi:DNA helicase/exodeoxyribonuclease V, subunit A [Gracilibacillus ureilyticus]|uniref:ATP-dependent helicase/nuclease subunit A n=1 Tax=Gracilibacillus ureilyticus TaxID=531814 RepID=A0A1H9SM97_9BACI|nr:helicase-exonuclease AddAB subunit AddA [Gracilibacillus ureilyticus]SER86044.1 DNA helicase/exodeoxyribonuclease V, subunit A [Gracilibacillus ureilyticus]
MPSWTKEQEEAIYQSGRNILVAAAAGSGKTAVLVERIIQKLLNREKPVDIDQLLVVTFTNAAAQEMRNRIGEALEEALANDPKSNHLKKQLSLLQHASISTLHSFCMDLVRKYAYQLDIDPGFRIADDVEADLIRQDVLEQLFEEWYGQEDRESQEAFFQVVDRFSNDRNDLDMENLILKMYEFSIQHPNPDRWLDQLAETYDIDEDVTEEPHWLTILKQEMKRQLEVIESQLNEALHITKDSDGPFHYAEALDEDLLMVQQAKGAIEISWDEAQSIFTDGKFKALSRKKVDCDEEKKNAVKALRDDIKKRWNKIGSEWFTRSLSSHLADMRKLYPTILEVTKMIKSFRTAYQEAKKERGLVDFSDLEHFALELLLEDKQSQRPSSLARALQQKYEEVMVDEYQDTNIVQETLLMSVSNQAEYGNMFMVGDVKQSIYRFRHAEPALFIEKYNRFGKAEDSGYRIDLARNFRSRNDVLSAANYVFRQLFDPEVGDIDYDEDAELIYGNRSYDDVPLTEPETEVYIIDQERNEAEKEELNDEMLEMEEDLEKAQLEARAYAEKIQTWIGHREKAPIEIMDKRTSLPRKAEYRDIVILLRSMTWAPTIMEEFKKQGIPVYAELASGYLAAIEIQVMISLLKVIDNPRQDIPLASVLKSPIVGLNEDELAKIRLAERNASYYDALKTYSRVGDSKVIKDTIQPFLTRLKKWRREARQGALSQLIWTIFQETGYYDFVGGIPGGRQRQANLRALYDRAKGYESTSFRGLFRFLRFIERMEEKGDDLGAAKALGEQEDVVRIMTIHKSKGLEFPLVIVGAMNKQFNQQDLREKYLLHKELGFASKYIDPEKRIMYPTLIYHAIKKEMHRELLAEEMRVLYVALTRAREKLVLVGTVPSLEKKKKKWESMVNHGDWVLPNYYRLESASYLDWIGAGLVRHKHGELLRTDDAVTEIPQEILEDQSKWWLERVHSSKYQEIEETSKQAMDTLEEAINKWHPLPLEDTEEKILVERHLSYIYPHQDAVKYRAKQTVTEMKRQHEVRDSYSDQSIIEPFRAPIRKRPRFMQQEKRLTRAEIGTAMHTVMQHIPLDREWNESSLVEFVAKLEANEILTREEGQAINYSAIAQFFATDIGKFLLQHEVEREIPFSLTLPANEVYPAWTGEEERIFLQGVIDCLIKTEDGWILLDYKTDQITSQIDEQAIKTLRDRYKIQVELYAKALEDIWKQPIQQKFLYYFDQSLLIEV